MVKFKDIFTKETKVTVVYHGKGLRKFRQKLGISVRDLGKVLGISGAYISQIENGKRTVSDSVANYIMYGLTSLCENRVMNGKRR